MSLARLAERARAVRLKAKARGDLNDALAFVAGNPGIGYLAKCSAGTDVGRVRIRIRELGMVEQVEEISAYLELQSFGDRGGFRQGHVKIHQTRPGQRVPLKRPVSTKRGAIDRLRVGRKRTCWLCREFTAVSDCVAALSVAEARRIEPVISATVGVARQQLAGYDRRAVDHLLLMRVERVQGTHDICVHNDFVSSTGRAFSEGRPGVGGEVSKDVERESRSPGEDGKQRPALGQAFGSGRP